DIEPLLPRGKSTLKRDMAGGLAVAFMGEPPGTGSQAMRELFAFFNREGRAVEVRVRYTDAPGKPAGGMAKLLSQMKARYGPPEVVPSSWVAAWSDQPARKPAPVQWRWQDDLTVMTCQHDAFGVEVALRDRPPGEGEPRTVPLQYLPRGPKDCTLGMA